MDLFKAHQILKNAIRTNRGLVSNIADDVWPKGGILKCEHCGEETVFTKYSARHFLAHGWPECCGHTMTVSGANRVD